MNYISYNTEKERCKRFVNFFCWVIKVNIETVFPIWIKFTFKKSSIDLISLKMFIFWLKLNKCVCVMLSSAINKIEIRKHFLTSALKYVLSKGCLRLLMKNVVELCNGCTRFFMFVLTLLFVQMPICNSLSKKFCSNHRQNNNIWLWKIFYSFCSIIKQKFAKQNSPLL